MRKIRVLIGANDMILGGVQRLVIDYLKYFDRTHFEVELVVLMQFPGKATFMDEIPKDVKVQQLSFKGFGDFGQWLTLARLLGRRKPDVVKTATFFSNTVFLLLRPFFGYTVVAAEHNTVRRKPFGQRLVDRLLLPGACTVVGDSKLVVDFVSESEGINPKHFTVIYNGVDLGATKEAERGRVEARASVRKELNVPDTAHLIVTVGRLTHQKNHALMLKAFARLRQQRNDVQLAIVGDGSLRKELEATAGEGVHFTGERKDVERFYMAADSFLLTSRHEGFCIAVMEALAFGVPVVSTKVAGVSEYLVAGENGFFASDTAENVARKVEELLNLSPEACARMSVAARKTAEAYGTDRYAKAYNELFARCAI